MSLRRSLAVSRNELRLLRQDPWPVVLLVVMPLLVMPILAPAYRAALALTPGVEPNGAIQAVPGMAVMFGFFLATTTTIAFFREHSWCTWDRLRASSASPTELVVGKLLPVFAAAVVNLTVLFAIGVLLFGLEVRGGYAALAALVLALALLQVMIGLAIVAVARTIQQASSLANLGAMVLAGLGGALTPINTLPSAARAVAPATPGYWAMRGFTDVFTTHSAGGAAVASLVLVAFAAGLGLLGVARFRVAEPKTTWA